MTLTRSAHRRPVVRLLAGTGVQNVRTEGRYVLVGDDLAVYVGGDTAGKSRGVPATLRNIERASERPWSMLVKMQYERDVEDGLVVMRLETAAHLMVKGY